MITAKKTTRRIRSARKPERFAETQTQTVTGSSSDLNDTPRHTALSVFVPEKLPDVPFLRAIEATNSQEAARAWTDLPESLRLRIRQALADMSWDELADDRRAADSLPMLVAGGFAAGIQLFELLAARTMAEL